MIPAFPPGVRALPVRGGANESRRRLLARLPRPLPEAAARVADALRAVALEFGVPPD
jgi:hypothetical protein